MQIELKYKFSNFIVICFLGVLFFAESSVCLLNFDLEPVFQIKTQSSDSIAFDAKYFEKMNQYFEYGFNKKNHLLINDEIDPLSQIKMQVVDGREFSIDFKGANLESMDLSVYTLSSENKDSKMAVVLKPIQKKDSKYFFKVEGDYQDICVLLKNRFALFNICQDKNNKPDFFENINSDDISIIINNKPAEKEGVVLLQNFEKPIQFQVSYGAQVKIQYQVVLRLPLLKKISKLKNESKVSVHFYDFDILDSEWDDEIPLDQNFFELKLNSIITVRQEISFANNISNQSAFSESFKMKPESKSEAPIKTERILNSKLSLGFVSSGYLRTDQFYDMVLVSKNGLFLQFQYSQDLNQGRFIDYSVQYKKIKIVDNTEKVPVAGSETSDFSLQGVFRKVLIPELHLTAGLAWGGFHFFKTNAQVTGIESVSSQILGFPIGVLGVFKIYKDIELNIPIEYTYLMSADQISAGAMISYGLEISGAIQENIFYGGFKMQSKNQKYESIDQVEDHILIYLGHLF